MTCVVITTNALLTRRTFLVWQGDSPDISEVTKDDFLYLSFVGENRESIKRILNE